MSEATMERAASFQIDSRTIGPGQPVFLTGEEGQANQGRLDVAQEMIHVAARAGLDAIEFQLAIAEDLYVRKHPMRAVYAQREFSRGQLAALFDTARQAGIIAYAAPLSSRLVPVLAEVGCPAFNINATDLNNPNLLDAVAQTGRPLFLSAMMAELTEIDWALARLRRRQSGPVVLLHGQHVMMTGEGRGVPEHDVNLASLGFLAARYGLPVGFIDHTSNLLMPAIAAAAGACMVTKHFTMSRALRGPDWHICLEPEELAEMVRRVRLADAARGAPGKRLASGEAADRSQMRRSIVAASSLRAGTVLSPEHLTFKRPGTGLAPHRVDEVVGRRLRVDLAEDDPVRLEDTA